MPSQGLVYITSATFSAASSVNVDNCFSATYDHYYIKIESNGDNAAGGNHVQLRASGSNDSTSNYDRQRIDADSTSVSAARQTGTTYFTNAGGYRINASLTGSYVRSWTELWISHPYSAQNTRAYVNNSATSGAGADIAIQFTSYTHNVASAFDGFTAYPSGGIFTGSLVVYGLALA